MMIFGIVFRLVLIAVAVVLDRSATFLRNSGLLERLYAIWPGGSDAADATAPDDDLFR